MCTAKNNRYTASDLRKLSGAIALTLDEGMWSGDGIIHGRLTVVVLGGLIPTLAGDKVF